MKKLLTGITALIIMAGIVLAPQIVTAATFGYDLMPTTQNRSFTTGDLGYSIAAYSMPYIYATANARQQAEALNKGYYGGYGYTAAGAYSPYGYSPYGSNYGSMSSGLVGLRPVPYGYSGYAYGYPSYGGYGYNGSNYNYLSPYQSLMNTTNSLSYMAFVWGVPATDQATAQREKPVDVAGLQAQSTANSFLNQNLGPNGYAMPNSWGSQFSMKPIAPNQTNGGSTDDGDWSSTFKMNGSDGADWQSGFSTNGAMPAAPSESDFSSTFRMQ